MSGAIPLFSLRAYIKGAKLSQNARSHLKILGTRSKFRTDDSQILGATVQNLVATAILSPGFLHPWLTWCTQDNFHLLSFSFLDKARRLIVVTSSLYNACSHGTLVHEIC